MEGESELEGEEEGDDGAGGERRAMRLDDLIVGLAGRERL